MATRLPRLGSSHTVASMISFVAEILRWYECQCCAVERGKDETTAEPGLRLTGLTARF